MSRSAPPFGRANRIANKTAMAYAGLVSQFRRRRRPLLDFADRRLDAWTHNFFPKDAKTQSMAELFSPRTWPMWVNPAPAASAPPDTRHGLRAGWSSPSRTGARRRSSPGARSSDSHDAGRMCPRHECPSGRNVIHGRAGSGPRWSGQAHTACRKSARRRTPSSISSSVR